MKKLFKCWGHVQTMRGAICFRTNRSRASGVPCGSSYGDFCVFMQARKIENLEKMKNRKNNKIEKYGRILDFYEMC